MELYLKYMLLNLMQHSRSVSTIDLYVLSYNNNKTIKMHQWL
jgi:hypothetical protein